MWQGWGVVLVKAQPKSNPGTEETNRVPGTESGAEKLRHTGEGPGTGADQAGPTRGCRRDFCLSVDAPGEDETLAAYGTGGQAGPDGARRGAISCPPHHPGRPERRDRWPRAAERRGAGKPG